MYRDKSLKQFKLHQLVDEEYSLTSGTGLGNCFSSANLTIGGNNTNLIGGLSSGIGKNRTQVANDENIKKKGRYMHYNRQSQKQQHPSFVRSKQVLQKFTHKLSTLPTAKTQPQSSTIDIVRSKIEQTTNEITYHLDKKIDQSFTQILNSNKIMNHQALVDGGMMKDNDEKGNSNGGLSLFQGTKMLMTEYWQQERAKKASTQSMGKSHSQARLRSNFQQQSSLPKINQKAYSIMKNNQKNILGKWDNNEKLNQQETLLDRSKQIKQQQNQHEQQYIFKAGIINGKIQNDTIEFIEFQRTNFKRWEDVLFVLECIEKFCTVYRIESARVDLKRVLEVIEDVERRESWKDIIERLQRPRQVNKGNGSNSVTTTLRTYTTHELLSCFDDAQQISENHPHSKGIRFYGPKGKMRAIIKIQSHFRRFLSERKLKQLKALLQKILLIQRSYRSYLMHSKTKALIAENQLKKIQKFNKIQEQFRENYRQKELTKRVKYEIHICSFGGCEWSRVATQNLNERQNIELSRIYRIATKSTPLIETRVIYIAPCELSRDIVNYYKKIFQFGSSTSLQEDENPYSDKLTILWPENVQKLLQTLSLTRKVLYSKTTLNKIKRIIKNNYAYIVPSRPSIEFISLCNELNLPLYSSEPQKLLYLQTQAGVKQFSSVLKDTNDQSFSILPYSSDIYTKVSFINQLTFLVFTYPKIKRWVLKIDSEHHSRGLAYIDTSKILTSQIATKLTETYPKQRHLKKHVYDRLYQSLITFKQERIVPVSKQVYRSQQEYLNHFLAYGGTIEAAINNFQTDLQNQSFTVEIEPDQEWKFVTSYYKITHKNRTVAAYYDSQREIQPPIQIQFLVKELVRRKFFGFFTFDFVKIPVSKGHVYISNQESESLINRKLNSTKESSIRYLNGIKCHLDEFSSASFLKQFLSKDTNVLYVPFLSHPSLKELRIQTFFHLCRLQNISFDIKRKIGNVFMFLSGLESGCMGLMSFNGASKEETFAQVSDVLEFLSGKLNQTKHQLKNVPKDFTAIRNVVNGFLKRTREKKLLKETKNSKRSTNITRSLSRNQVI